MPSSIRICARVRVPRLIYNSLVDIMFVADLVEVDQEFNLQRVQTGRLTGYTIHTDIQFVKRLFTSGNLKTNISTIISKYVFLFVLSLYYTIVLAHVII